MKKLVFGLLSISMLQAYGLSCSSKSRYGSTSLSINSHHQTYSFYSYFQAPTSWPNEYREEGTIEVDNENDLYLLYKDGELTGSLTQGHVDHLGRHLYMSADGENERFYYCR